MTTQTPADWPDPPPVPPVRPDNLACCDTGCIPCVFDVHEERLEAYREALRAWRERRGGASKAAPGVDVLSTLALMGAMPGLVERYAASGGGPARAEFAPTNALVTRILGGELADAAILTREYAHQLMVDGLLLAGSRVDLAISRVGIAVRAAAPRPDIGTLEALKATLVASTGVCYSRIGASGLFFAGLIKRLGIEEAVNARATIIPGGFTARVVADGRAQLAVQQLSELQAVQGIDIVGPLPAGAESVTVFSGALLTHGERPDEARRFLRFLASADALAMLQAAGLEPPGPA